MASQRTLEQLKTIILHTKVGGGNRNQCTDGV